MRLTGSTFSGKSWRLAACLALMLWGTTLPCARAQAQGGADRLPLWSPPTSGPPIELDYLPAGTQAIVHWRAAETAAQPEGARTLAALGPLGEWLTKTLPAATGVPLDQSERIVLGLLSTEEGFPPMCAVVYATDRLSESDLAKAWGGQRKRIAGREVFIVNGVGHARIDGAGKPIVLMGPEAEIESMLAKTSARASLQRELAELLATTDSSRQLTILSNPYFWTTSGKPYWGGAELTAGEWFRWFFGAHARGACLSAHLNEALFLELRVAVSGDQKPLIAARDYRRRVNEMAERVRSDLASNPPGDYDRPVLEQLPKMLSVVDGFYRMGTNERETILRVYLPGTASHNLALAAKLFFERKQ